MLIGHLLTLFSIVLLESIDYQLCGCAHTNLGDQQTGGEELYREASDASVAARVLPDERMNRSEAPQRSYDSHCEKISHAVIRTSPTARGPLWSAALRGRRTRTTGRQRRTLRNPGTLNAHEQCVLVTK